MTSRLLIKLAVITVLLFSASMVQAGTVSHEVKLYHDEKFQEEQEKFIPADTIYFVIDFSELQKQTYALSIEWIRPDGLLVRNDSYDLTVSSEPANKRVYFWMQLHEKGPLSQMISGNEYSPKVFGDWKIRLYCDGEVLSTTEFTMTDTIL
jgi:hypothetical protein